MGSVSGLTSNGVTGVWRARARKHTSGRSTRSMSQHPSAGWGSCGRGSRDRRSARRGVISSPRWSRAMGRRTQAMPWANGPPGSGTIFSISAIRRARLICTVESSMASPTPWSCWRVAANWWPRAPRTRRSQISKNSIGRPSGRGSTSGSCRILARRFRRCARCSVRIPTTAGGRCDAKRCKLCSSRPRRRRAIAKSSCC